MNRHASFAALSGAVPSDGEAGEDAESESEDAADDDAASATDGLAGWEEVFDGSDLTAEDFENDPLAEDARAEAKLQWIAHTHALSSSVRTIAEGVRARTPKLCVPR